MSKKEKQLGKVSVTIKGKESIAKSLKQMFAATVVIGAVCLTPLITTPSVASASVTLDVLKQKLAEYESTKSVQLADEIKQMVSEGVDGGIDPVLAQLKSVQADVLIQKKRLELIDRLNTLASSEDPDINEYNKVKKQLTSYGIKVDGIIDLLQSKVDSGIEMAKKAKAIDEEQKQQEQREQKASPPSDNYSDLYQNPGQLKDGVKEGEPVMKADPEAEAKAAKEKEDKDEKERTSLMVVGAYDYLINGESKKYDMSPFTLNGRLMVPLRAVIEMYPDGSCIVGQSGKGKVKVDLTRNKKKLTVVESQARYHYDGEVRDMDVAPVVKNGRIFVPIRTIIDVFNLDVKWNPLDESLTLMKKAE